MPIQKKQTPDKENQAPKKSWQEPVLISIKLHSGNVNSAYERSNGVYSS
jgi:hypothetical protein